MGFRREGLQPCAVIRPDLQLQGGGGVDISIPLRLPDMKQCYNGEDEVNMPVCVLLSSALSANVTLLHLAVGVPG